MSRIIKNKYRTVQSFNPIVLIGGPYTISFFASIYIPFTPHSLIIKNVSRSNSDAASNAYTTFINSSLPLKDGEFLFSLTDSPGNYHADIEIPLLGPVSTSYRFDFIGTNAGSFINAEICLYLEFVEYEK